ncbi:MAG: ribbon-helix-helix protein, CopG family [Chloroflexi bacterium]|jgi:predicted DNA-binding protein|nr:ribbon-helix-helix protein, CopG family [Chloroflexota bacterium]
MEKIITARIGGQTHDGLMAIAKEKDRSVSYLVRKAVEQYLEEVGGKKSRKRKEA